LIPIEDLNSRFQGYFCITESDAYISTSSLMYELSVSLGMSLVMRIKKAEYFIYVVVKGKKCVEINNL